MRTLLTATAAITVMHVFNINTTPSTTTNFIEIRLDNDIMIYKPQINVLVIETVTKKEFLL